MPARPSDRPRSLKSNSDIRKNQTSTNLSQKLQLQTTEQATVQRQASASHGSAAKFATVSACLPNELACGRASLTVSGQPSETRQVFQSKRSAQRLLSMLHSMARKALAPAFATISQTETTRRTPTRLEHYRENGCRSARSVIASTSARSSSSPAAHGRNLSLNAASTSSNRTGQFDSSGIG